MRAPISGSCAGPNEGNAARSQAAVMWQWYNHLERMAPPAKKLLRINLDETAVCLHPEAGKGNVFVTTRPVYRLQRWKTRTYFTHVAVVCDQIWLQPHMPQVIIGNERTLLLRALPTLRRDAPANVVLVRQKSAWNNAALMASIVGWIAESVRLHAENYQPVLVMDVVSLHTRRVVLQACQRHGVWTVFVPARTTFFLQPLDVHVFHLYKAALRGRYHELLCDSARGELDVPTFLTCIYHALDVVMCGRDWSPAFDKCGLGRGQSAVAEHVRRDLGIADAGASAVRPTAAELARCFPRRAQITIALLLPAGHDVGDAAELRVEPIAARTRRRLRAMIVA